MTTTQPRRSISCVTFPVIWLLVTSLAFAQVKGDLNNDGKVDLVDSAMIRDHLLERGVLKGTALARADLDGDGQIRLADLVYLSSHQFIPPDETMVTLDGSVTLVLVRVPVGSFAMGSSGDTGWDLPNEGPVHTVDLGYDFYLGKYEVTQQQWLAVMGQWPGSAPGETFGLGDAFPAYNISWSDAQDFIAALNAYVANTDQGPATFRLPSEAEWEYACRASRTTRFWFGDSALVPTECSVGLPGDLSDYAWFCGNNGGYGSADYGSKPVGARLPNVFGLYDMHGNVWEWCQDWWHGDYNGAPTDGSAWEMPEGSYRVVRGGYWRNYPRACRSASRGGLTPVSRAFHVGFRVARGR